MKQSTSRSPEGLTCACSSDGSDHQTSGLQENLEVITKYRTKVAEIEEELQALEPALNGHAQHGRGGQHHNPKRSSNGGTHGVQQDELMPDADIT